MTKEELIDVIKKCEPALVLDITVGYFEPEENPEFFDSNFKYQIDDRIERSDESVVEAIRAKLGSDYDIYMERLDAFPNGYAYYSLSISNYPEED